MSGGNSRASRPRYPSYRPSGVAWLGEIPAHWSAVRMRFLCKTSPSKTELAGRDPDSPVSFVPMEAISEDGRLAVDQTKPLADVGQGYTYFRDGDVILAKITPCFENGKGALCFGLEGGIGFGTTELHVLRPQSDAERRFIWYLCISHPFRDQGAAAMYGAAGQKRVPEDFVRDFRVPTPPLPEQQAIAAFLDRETARIDALLAAKQRLLDLLAEQRAALITRAVTRGLDPGVSLKESGAEWLGEIPAHWEAVPLRRLAAPGYKTFVDGDWIESPFITSDGIRLIQTGNVGVGAYREQGGRFISESTFHLLRCTIVHPNDVLICRMAEPVGRACLAPNLGLPMITCVDVCILRPAREHDPRFLVYALSSGAYLNWMQTVCRGGTRDRVSRSMLGAIPLPMPPAAEQQAIADYLDRQTARLDALAGRVRRAMDLLREYRAALITAAVTGQIDVRGGGD